MICDEKFEYFQVCYENGKMLCAYAIINEEDAYSNIEEFLSGGDRRHILTLYPDGEVILNTDRYEQVLRI